MKKRTAAIAAFLSLMSIGQALVIGSGAALTSAVVMLFVPEKAQAEYSDVYFYRGRDKYHDGDYYGAICDFNKGIAIYPRYRDAYVELA
ncbi:MAG: hypothetical protein AB8A45_03230 [Prochlorococcus sp.]